MANSASSDFTLHGFNRGGNNSAKASVFQIYPDTPHAFHADYRTSYREAAAKDGWSRMLAWFQQQGVA